MKTKILKTLIFSLLIISQSCELQREDYERITPDLFFQTKTDAELAVASLYNAIYPLFTASFNSAGIISDISAGDYLRSRVGIVRHDRCFYHQWTPEDGAFTDAFFKYYKVISSARIVAAEIEKMDIPENVKKPLVAEAKTIAGWIGFILYDMYGPPPYPTDEMLANPQAVEYPSRPTNEEMANILESLLNERNNLMDPDFTTYFGRVNKGVAGMILMKLYMLEAGRTGDQAYYLKAKSLGEEIIASGWYELQSNYLDVFSINNKRNREIIYAPASSYEFQAVQWHATSLPNNYPSRINETVGAYGMIRMIWDFYENYIKNDYRLDGFITEYVSTTGVTINRENPYDNRHGVGGGPFVGLKYDLDPNMIGAASGHDYVIYRYAMVILSMAEILNELGTNASVNAPVMQQVAKDGTTLVSDGGTSAYSFLNAIRVRAGIEPLSNLSKEQLRDSILMERGFELYAEGDRRRDLIRYQRVTDGQGYKIFDSDPNKFYYPIPVEFINEFKGNLTQNPGY